MLTVLILFVTPCVLAAALMYGGYALELTKPSLTYAIMDDD